MRIFNQFNHDQDNTNFLMQNLTSPESLQNILRGLGASIEMQNKIQYELESNPKYQEDFNKFLLQDDSFDMQTASFANLQQGPKEKKHRNYMIKKKTELCKTHELGLECPYKDKCSFAHGAAELRVKILVPMNYKTVKCKQYHEEMYCHYGPRCQFVHKPQKSEPLQKIKVSYTKLLDFVSLCLSKEISDSEGIDYQKSLMDVLNENPNVINMGLKKLDIFKSLRDFSYENESELSDYQYYHQNKTQKNKQK